MRSTVTLLTLLFVASLGCVATGTPIPPPTGPDPEPVRAPTPGPAASEGAGPTFIPLDKVPPERRVWAYMGGRSKLMDMDDARSRGFTVVDLSDDWVPYIFWSRTPGKDDTAPNDYAENYVALANDRVDVDGVKLPRHGRNYLDVYGIPPSLGVLRRRFLEEEKNPCFKKLDLTPFASYLGAVRVGEPAASERELRKFYGARTNYKRALRKARVKTLEALEQIPRYKGVATRYRRYKWRHDVIRGMQKRLVCEGMFGSHKPRLKPGIITWATRQALKRFERKHNVYGWGLLFQETIKALGRTPLENNHEALARVLRERVVSAARVLEDGSVSGTYKDAQGKRRKVRDLVDELGAIMMRELGLTDPERSLAFMREHSAERFKDFRVAVRLPQLPPYYSDQMDLEAIIDRGDVWYDFPNKFNARGRLIRQPRKVYPHLTLYVRWQGQKIPLVRWRTTIGGWQAEMRHDQEYYKYKVSDVGPRVWRNIVAGPVWVPPPKTPSRDLVKIRPVRGRSERIVANQTMGPGYASAYGLVAAFHVTASGRDNQVRTHGTVNYMSIKSSNGFSHGCHRLFNFRAVRLFSFVLAHRAFKRLGQSKLSYQRRFEHRGEEYQIDLRTRGYYYELTPPMPVITLEGNIRGKLKKPVEEYVKKPTVVYQDDLPTVNEKTPAGAPRVTPKKDGGLMSQPQTL